MDRKRALVQTVDFFTPIVDDPRAYGQIAAANALSDVYAMGGRPLTALNLMGFPTELISPSVIRAIFRGGAEKIKQAGCILLGGHTIRNPEPICGFAVTGVVSPKRLLTNANARPGDLLVLTKPLGTGIIATGVKRGVTSPALERKAIRIMTHLNTLGAELAERGLARAAVDITGFGLLGHLGAMCRASGVGAEISAGSLPVISRKVFDLIAAGCVPAGSRDNLAYASAFTDWRDASPAQKTLATDAQTSGGLLVCVPEKNADAVLRSIRRFRPPCTTIIGRIVRSAKPTIRVKA